MDDPFLKTGSVLGANGGDAAPRARVTVPDHELLRCIGKGSYGEVWLARNVVGTFRAVKIVYRDNFLDPRPYEREFSGIQKFEPLSRSNEGLVDILQIGRNDGDGYFYYVMELADDASDRPAFGDSDDVNAELAEDHRALDPATYVPRTLAREVKHHARLPFEECLNLGLSLSLTLGHLHRHGLIHRDIKPSNIIFVNGVPKLADIGLVTDFGGANSFVGTEGFIPPEGPNSPQADIYSLGKVLYEISMGKDRQDFPEPFTAIRDTPDSAALLELNAIILKACAPDPKQRYATADDMHVDLALLQSGKSVKKKHATERQLKRAKRVGGIAALVAAVAVSAFAFEQTQTREARRLGNELRRQLSTSHVFNGMRQLDAGDPYTALLWFAEAAKLDAEDSARTAMHRARFGATLGECTAPVQMMFHSGPIYTCQFSRDGKRILTASQDGTARIWDVESGEPVGPPMQEKSPILSAMFDRDETRVVTTGAARVWEVRTAEPITPWLARKHSDPSRWWQAAEAWFNPNATRVATASGDGTANVWSIPAGQLLYSIQHTSSVTSVAFSPDGAWLVSGSSDGTLVFAEAGTGKLVGTSKVGTPIGDIAFSRIGNRMVIAANKLHTNIGFVEVRTVSQTNLSNPVRIAVPGGYVYAALNQDGSRVLAGGEAAQIFDTSTGEPVTALLPSISAVRHVTFAPDDARVIVCSDKHVAMVFDAKSGEPASPPLPHGSYVNYAEFSPNGTDVATCGEDGILKIWRLRAGSGATVLRHGADVRTARYSPDGRTVLTAGSDGAARFWDAATGSPLTPVLHHTDAVTGAGFSPDGKFVLTRSGSTARVWETATGRESCPALTHTGKVTLAAFSPNGLRVVTTSEDNTARVWDTETGQPVTPPLPHFHDAVWAAFHPDSRRIVTASLDSRLRIWDVTSGKLVAIATNNASLAFAAFSPDGNWVVTTGGDQAGKLWDAVTLRPIGIPFQARGHLAAAVFSRDMRRLATRGTSGKVNVWDTQTSELALPQLLHKLGVSDFGFSPDERFIATASIDHTARIWDSGTGELVQLITHGDNLNTVDWSPDGRHLLTASKDGTARITRLADSPVQPADFTMCAELFSAFRKDAVGNLVQVSNGRMRELWEWWRQKYAGRGADLKERAPDHRASVPNN